MPTISAGRFVAEKAKVDGYFPAVVRPKAAAIGPQIQDTFARAYKAGVKIAFGTDQGVAPHGDNGWEFVYMVEGRDAADGRHQVGHGRRRAPDRDGESSAPSRPASSPISWRCPATPSPTSAR